MLILRRINHRPPTSPLRKGNFQPSSANAAILQGQSKQSSRISNNGGAAAIEPQCPQRAQPLDSDTFINPSCDSSSLPAVSRTTQDSVTSTTSFSNIQTPNISSITNIQSSSKIRQTNKLDPTAVYDSWPEYQRDLDNARMTKATKEAEETAKRAFDEKKKTAEEGKRAEGVALNVEEAKKMEEEQKRESPVKEQRAKPKKKEEQSQRRKKLQAARKSTTGPLASSFAPVASTAATNGVLPARPLEAKVDREALLRQMMARIQELNEEDSDLVEQVWEEERQVNFTKSAVSRSAAERLLAEGQQSSQRAAQTPSHDLNVLIYPVDRPANSTSDQNGIQSELAPQPDKAASTEVSQPPTVAVQPTTTPIQSPAVQQLAKWETGTTHWPPDKRGKLAAIATSWLNALPINSGRKVSAEEFERMLESNPSYIELCEMLEATGMKLERVAFAKSLLQAVPDVKPTASPIPLPQQRLRTSFRSPSLPTNPLEVTVGMQPILSGTTTKASYPQPADAITAARNHHSGSTIRHYINESWGAKSVGSSNNSIPQDKAKPPAKSHYFAAPPIAAPDQQTLCGAPHSTLASDLPKSAQRTDAPTASVPSATKEEAARKRKYSDLIDVIAKVDSDDELPPGTANRSNASSCSASIIWF